MNQALIDWMKSGPSVGGEGPSSWSPQEKNVRGGMGLGGALGYLGARGGLGPLSGVAAMAMPGRLDNPEEDPNYRRAIQEQGRTGAHGMPQRIRNQWGMQPTQPSTAPPSSPMDAQTGGQGAGGLAQLLQGLMGR
jgi:hypothetical protein